MVTSKSKKQDGRPPTGPLRESEELFRTMADTAPVMIWMAGPDRLRNFFNKGWLDFRGRTPDEEAGEGWEEGVHPEDLARFLELYAASFEARRPYATEYRLRRRDGEYRWILARGVPRHSPAGEFEGFIGTCVDIDDRKRAELESARLASEVEAERRRLRDIVGSVPGVVWEAWGEPDEANQRIDFVSDYVERMLGYTVGEWLAEPNFWLKLVHPEDRERAAAEARAKFESREGGTSEFRWLAKDGRVVHVEAHSGPVFDGAGRPVGMRGVTMDITMRRRAEEALRASEELSQAVLNSLQAHIAVLDREGHIIAVNEAWRRFSAENGGAAAHTDAGANYLQVCAAASGGDGAGDILEGVRAVLEGRRESFQAEYPCHSPGEERWFLLTATPLPGGRGGAVVSHIVITERKQADEALKAYARERERMFEEVSTPVVPVLEGVLVLPLIGSLDTLRMERATKAALEEVSRTGARAIIIDITGARVVDSHAVANLGNLVAALKLVGAEAVVTGVGAHAAQSLVGLGLDLHGLRTHRTLAQALAALIRHGARAGKPNGAG